MKKEAKLLLGIVSGCAVLGGICNVIGYNPANTEQDGHSQDMVEVDESIEETDQIEIGNQEETYEENVEVEPANTSAYIEQPQTYLAPETHSASESDTQSAYIPQPVSEEVEQEVNSVMEDPTLPLKAICKDGTIQYQDDPTGPNYRGMCSSHGGIIEKLGRIP